MSALAPIIPRRSSLPITRARAFSRLIACALYFLIARLVAERSSAGLVSEDWQPLVEQAMLAFLLIVGYAGLGYLLEKQDHPVAQQGLVFRPMWLGEAGLGLAIGWSIAVACLVPMLVFGGMGLHFSWSAGSIGWLFADAAYFLLQTLTVQVLFRGYPADCATRAVGELPGVLMLAVLYAILQAQLPGSSTASIAVSVALGLLLSLAFVRTRALWLPWGLHFGWVASRAVLFGLPVEGASVHSPIVQGYPVAPFGMTGGDFGLDGSWFSFLVLLFAVPFVYRATRDLSFHFNAPVLVPAGIPVDMDAAARRQHDAATRPEIPEVKPLVQIMPLQITPTPLASERDQVRTHRFGAEEKLYGEADARTELDHGDATDSDQ